MAVVLAIIAILAGMLTPIVVTYIDQARTTRALADVKRIGQAISFFKRDTAVFPPYDTLAAARTGSSPKTCLVSGTSAATLPANGTATWTCTTTGLLNQYLNVNSMGVTTALGAGGAIAFRGPYLDGLDGLDPWGNPYIVNSGNLTETATNWAFALSAGPDSNLDTAQNLAKTSVFVTVEDDIASLIK